MQFKTNPRQGNQDSLLSTTRLTVVLKQGLRLFMMSVSHYIVCDQQNETKGNA
jgi:hypothetical protein